MFDDEVREQIFAKSELQKIDLMTLSLVIKAIDMYIRELSGDISELLNDMTPDERNLLRTKMSNLASKL